MMTNRPKIIPEEHLKPYIDGFGAGMKCAQEKIFNQLESLYPIISDTYERELFVSHVQDLLKEEGEP